ncbi:MAG TPA: DNRLRE domain-containing protein, partial [Acidimicrobiales bacterium]|nr:DNRLRE domain-containing protein [Acidimicrobiales bacterium]
STPAGTPSTLTATATDDFDQNLAGRIQWTSSQDGVLGIGASLTVTLKEGRHTLFAAVTDSDGATGTTQEPFTVSPTPPVVNISAPAPGALLFAERALTFAGAASDATDGPLSANLIWSSDRDGLIGAGATFSTSRLSLGTHTITAAVTDAGGLRSQAQRTVVIRPRNTPPVVTITAPADGAALLAGRRLHFTATARDAEDGNLDAALAWSSSRDGALGRGPTLLTSTLSPGTHVITASVTDQAGETTTATVTVTVNPATLNLPAIADTTVDASTPTTILGTAPTLTADGTPVKQVFLRFAVSGVQPFVIGRARLRLTTGAGATASSNSGGALYVITDNTWSEAGASYATRPIVAGAPIAASGAVAANKTVEFDVSAAITGDGTYNFALLTTSTDDVVYLSREAAAGGPQLVLDLRQPTDSRVTITAPTAGSIVPFDLAVTLQGTTLDQEDGDLSAAIHWTSNLDGLLGVGPTVVRWLRPGVHTITASVTDADGNPGSTSVRVEVQARDVGVRDFRFGAGVEDGTSNEATSRPAESKLWYVDGIWWATLFSTDAGAHHIFRLDPLSQTWVDTGILVDERPISRQDVLWDGTKLYMASRCAGTFPENRLLRYTYVAATKQWLLDTGFPVELPGGGTGALSIAKDSTGTLWVTFILFDQVYVSHSVGTDSEWGEAIPVPVGDGSETLVHPDDLSQVIALPGQIGIFWSNQNTRRDYFAVHDDAAGDDPTTWHLEIAGQGGKFADGHINLKLASDGRVFAMVKTSYGVPGQILDGLLVRAAGGGWSPLYAISLVDDNPTRELVLLDETQRKVFAFYSLNHESIYYKVSDMDTIAFPDGPGTPFIVNAAVNDINNPTGTKQNVTPA